MNTEAGLLGNFAQAVGVTPAVLEAALFRARQARGLGPGGPPAPTLSAQDVEQIGMLATRVQDRVASADEVARLERVIRIHPEATSLLHALDAGEKSWRALVPETLLPDSFAAEAAAKALGGGVTAPTTGPARARKGCGAALVVVVLAAAVLWLSL